jgi:hypothetical protein
MLRADVLVVETLGLLIGQLHHFPGTVGETLVHGEFSKRVACGGADAAAENGSRCFHPVERCKPYAKSIGEF